MYLIDPPSPIISSPTACADISVAALKRNLIQHTAVIRASNMTVSDDRGDAFELIGLMPHDVEYLVKGTKTELRRKLEKLLELREADLRVRDLVECVAEVEPEEQEEGELEGDVKTDEEDGEERYSQDDSEEHDGSQQV